MNQESSEIVSLPKPAEKQIRSVGDAAVSGYGVELTESQINFIRHTQEEIELTRLLMAKSDYDALQNAKDSLRQAGLL